MSGRLSGSSCSRGRKRNLRIMGPNELRRTRPWSNRTGQKYISTHIAWVFGIGHVETGIEISSTRYSGFTAYNTMERKEGEKKNSMKF